MLPSVRTGRLFYGWYIVAASCAILFFNAGARQAIGVMFKPMLVEFGWSRADVSLAFSLNMLVFALAMLGVGRLYDRYGPRWIIIGATILLTAGFLLTARITTLWQLFLCYGVLAALGLAGTSVPLLATLTSKWFVKWRGLAVSLALAGNCLGQFALVPLLTLGIAWYGWRVSYMVIGLIMLAVNIVLALLVIRGDPQHIGWQPLGVTANADPVVESTASLTSAPDMTLSQAMHTPAFWLFFGVMVVCGSGDFFITTHLIPFATDHGVSAVSAGNMLAWYGLMSLGGILVAGPLSDLIGHKLPVALTFALRVVLFGTILYIKTPLALYLFALLFGFTHLITAPLTPTLLSKLYGTRHLGMISSVINTAHHLAGGLWAYIAGVMFDRTGSYQIVFGVSAITALLAGSVMLCIREERHHP